MPSTLDAPESGVAQCGGRCDSDKRAGDAIIASVVTSESSRRAPTQKRGSRAYAIQR
jgi:hypothetical protein